MTVRTFTAVIHKEGDIYVADCPEEATENLKEATELYLEEFPSCVTGRPENTDFAEDLQAPQH